LNKAFNYLLFLKLVALRNRGLIISEVFKLLPRSSTVMIVSQIESCCKQ